MRSLVGCCVVGLLGCASFPSARLDVTAGVREVLQAPVVCGPMGFRKTPLQSRWGEYVRVTVQSPGALRGSAFVHANGETGETRSWSTGEGARVIEARFENLDPDQRYLLEREQPIDITLTGLEGVCEGAVFTVEQGELVPDIDERAWVVELERRGGPALAARREAARLAAEARRQAHYAAWEARRQLEVNAEVLVAQDERRQAHYAQWEAQRNPQPEAWVEFPTLVADGTIGDVVGGSTSVIAGGNFVGGSTSVIAGGNVGGSTSVIAGGDIVGSSTTVIAGGNVVGGSTSVISSGGVVGGSTSVIAGGSVVVGGNVASTSVVAEETLGEGEWAMPEQGRLREVSVTTEQHVVTSPTEWAPAPVTATVEVVPAEEEEVTAVEFMLPAFLQFMVQATVPVVVAPLPAPAPRVVRAVPVR